MKFKVDADRRYVLNSISEMVREIQTSDKPDSYHSVLEDAVTELIKLEMRESSYNDEPKPSFRGKTILSHAIDKVRTDLHQATPDFDFTEYFKAAEKQLQGPAAELAELQIQLRESKELSRLGDETLVRGSAILSRQGTRS